MAVGVVFGADVFHAVDAAALGTALHGAGAGHLLWVVSGEIGWEGRGWEEVVETYAEPVDDVAVDWVAGAAGELFYASGVDGDGVLEGS